MTEPEPLADAELVQRCAEGEEQAWTEFVRRFAPLLASLARRMLARRLDRVLESDVDEVVAEVFLALLRRDRILLRRYDPTFRVSTYLGVICRSQAGRLLERRGRQRFVEGRQEEGGPAAPPGSAPLEALLADERVQAVLRLRAALAGLPPRDRLLLSMRYLEGQDYRSIGAALGLSAESVGQLLHRAKSRLAATLADVRALFDGS